MATATTTSPTYFADWTLKECRSAKVKKEPAPHQHEALAKMNKWYAGRSGDADGGILVLPTGGGKTFTAVHFLCNGPLSDGYKVLWLAHTHHLLEQAFNAFSADVLGHIREPRQRLTIRVVSGTPGHYPPRDIKPSDGVVIGTLQTITNAHRDDLKQLQAFIDAAEGKLFVVFDEAHHSPAPSYRKLLMDLRAKGAPALGLTATPTYSDESRKGWLKKLFPQGILAQTPVGTLVASGVLAKPTFERAPTSVTPAFDDADYQKWLGTYRDVPEDVIDDLACNASRNGFIADTYANNRARYGKALIFTDRWYQCESIVEALKKRGVRADAVYSHVDAETASVEGRKKRDRDENAKALQRFRNGEVDVLVNVRMLTEGTDLPDAKTVFITRQTTSQILLTQMVGRALRGPKFGGTAQAFIVSFVDEWQQSIRWAEYDALIDGQADETTRDPAKRPPLQLISIELVKRLARQMDSGININSAPFTSLMPTGWYRVQYDACVSGQDEIETRDLLVMVFEDELAGFKAIIDSLSKSVPKAFENESLVLDEQKDFLDGLRDKHLANASRSTNDLVFDMFHVARHIGQGQGVPQFFPFDVRKDHDLDAIAADYIARDMGPKAIQEHLRAEFERKDRFWRAFFPRFEQMRSSYDACQARILSGGEGGAGGPVARPGVAPSFAEPDETIKEQVKRRDGNQCLACGATRGLQADHIIPAYEGGSNGIDNLQTLCRVCNSHKAKRTLRFTTQQTSLSSPPRLLEHFEVPRRDEVGDRDHWERFLRRTINFTFRCSAISDVKIAGRGDGYYNWTVDLVKGNSPSWLKPYLSELMTRIQEARVQGGKPELQSFTITAPGERPVTYPSKR